MFLSIVAKNNTPFVEAIERALVAVNRGRRLFVCAGIADKCDNEVWRNVAKCPLPPIATQWEQKW